MKKLESSTPISSAAYYFMGGTFLLLMLLLSNPTEPGKLQWLRVIVLAAIAVLFVLSFYHGVVKSIKVNSLQKNIWTSILGLIILFLFLEGTFMFIPKTIGSSRSLSSRLWFAWNWEPLNSQGFRDKEPLDNGKKNIFFLGDSFTAGQGIDDPADRFPDQFQAIYPNVNVHILAECDANTQTEYEYLENYPVEPDELVLAWFVNDIEGAARIEGKGFIPELPLLDRGLIGKACNHSYFLSFLYGIWPRNTDFGYGEFFKDVWEDRDILLRHQIELTRFVEYSVEREIPFRVLLFPRMRDVEGSQPFLATIKNHLDIQNVPYLDLSELIGQFPVEDRVVNPFDDHPSVLVHKKVAVELAKWMPQVGGVSGTMAVP